MKKTSVRKNGQAFGKMDILKFFFEEPERDFHLREIARLAGISPSTASKHLSYLTEKKIVTAKSEKGFSLFRSNAGAALYRDMKLFYNIYRIRNSGLVDYLAEELNNPKCIVLFGSFRRADNIASSDIDIFAETPVKKMPDLSKFEKILGHSIQLFQFSTAEIVNMAEKNKELLNNIVNGIVLEGFFEVFR